MLWFAEYVHKLLVIITLKSLDIFKVDIDVCAEKCMQSAYRQEPSICHYGKAL
jgi:hypothetical protein